MTSDTRAQRLIDEFENAAYLDSASPLAPAMASPLCYAT
jgi:hypothetical protein